MTLRLFVAPRRGLDRQITALKRISPYPAKRHGAPGLQACEFWQINPENDAAAPNFFHRKCYKHFYGMGWRPSIVRGKILGPDGHGQMLQRLSPWSGTTRRTLSEFAEILSQPEGLRALAVALIAVGVIGRLVRYLLQFPIWGDEAMLCLNLLDRGFTGLTYNLQYGQIVPILFFWAELVITRMLGFSELAMRLLPFLAGLAALGLFWRLAWTTIGPLAALFAVALLATARWPITMGAFVKPYSLDLFMAVGLLVPAVEWLRQPRKLGWLWVLAFIAPLALLGSYPAVFVAGGVSLALLPSAWRSGAAGRGLFILFNAFVASALFVNSYAIVDQHQHTSGLQDYWADAFPPWSPLPLLKWLILVHAGQLMAYPIGGSDGASVVTALLFAFGVWTWWKDGRRSLLVLFLTPYALNLLAAAMHLYPYGIARLSQDLAPAACLLIGTGLAALLERYVSSDLLRLRWLLGISATLALCAVGGLAQDVIRPYRDPETRWLQQAADAVLGRLQPGDQLVIVQDRFTVEPPFRWYLESQYREARWQGAIDWHQLRAHNGRLLTVNFWNHRSNEPSIRPDFNVPATQGWTAVEETPYTTRSGDGKWIFHVELSRWAPMPHG